MKLIDKLQPISAISNVATVGYQTLFAVFTNGAAGANYTGTKQFIAELSLSGVLVKSMTLTQATLVSAFLTLPSQSEV